MRILQAGGPLTVGNGDSLAAAASGVESDSAKPPDIVGSSTVKLFLCLLLGKSVTSSS